MQKLEIHRFSVRRSFLKGATYSRTLLIFLSISFVLLSVITLNNISYSFNFMTKKKITLYWHPDEVEALSEFISLYQNLDIEALDNSKVRSLIPDTIISSDIILPVVLDIKNIKPSEIARVKESIAETGGVILEQLDSKSIPMISFRNIMVMWIAWLLVIAHPLYKNLSNIHTLQMLGFKPVVIYRTYGSLLLSSVGVLCAISITIFLFIILARVYA